MLNPRRMTTIVARSISKPIPLVERLYIRRYIRTACARPTVNVFTSARSPITATGAGTVTALNIRRLYFSNSHEETGTRGIRALVQNAPFVAVGLILGGLTLTAVGLWKFYTSGVNAFPEAIRNDLRKALYYQNYGNDPEKAVKFYRSALNAAMHHPDLNVDGPEVTGIMIQLGTMFQDMGRTREAIDVLVMAFECLVHGRTMGTSNKDFRDQDQHPGQSLQDTEFSSSQDKAEDLHTQDQKKHGTKVMDGPTRLKTIGIAQKLGDLYHLTKKDEQAERYYLWSVEQLLINHDEKLRQSAGNVDGERLWNARDQEVVRKQFNFDKLPAWMSKSDLGASLEALGGFYASKGIYSNALPLYMRALSLVDAKSCHAAVLMCNISDAFAGQGNIDDATGWAERGLKVGLAQSGQECDEGCGVLLFNLGMLHEMKGNIHKAQDYYKQSKQHGLKTGFDRCIVESDKALKRLKENKEGTLST
ncbi:hypothetical protein BX616_000020 [Lobosporangium transversale]|uniref:Uncharacterized protein n=1 Tax=Lobosporangium transversale TaxID=64571 RepID=A0A1Y2GAU5_9FUNG|nr:hypothetical protein BCR41DRAFT_362614 [Lobosporangium transversale]KAF9919409.1 hypothetical protein BX616_000020 [Lobosporangium transversale]ORZ04547.1 hypothetical protein BCR41DRAFT_362614 [Lobosporangium transversale]|eukprot:XP_021876593.1 hypothetical protein BCR41DRAFT_362614 [Lobosporangium transversale]